MKADHPRAIDRYIDFFGNGAWMKVAVVDRQRPATADVRTIEREDHVVRDEHPRE
jgi:hypothetical protein